MGDPTDYAELLDPACLPDERAFDSALLVVEQDLTDASCMSIIEQLLSTEKPEPIAIFLSGISRAIPIETWIMDKLSFDKEDILESTASRLLSSLSVFFMFHILLKTHREIVLELGKYYREVQDAFSTMRALVSFRSHKRLQSRDELGRHSRKGHLMKSDDSDIAPALLAMLEIPIPRNSKEASDALAKLIDHQKALLCRYLKITRMPEIGEEIRAGVISNFNQVHSADASIPTTTTVCTEENPISSTMESGSKLGPPIELAQSYEMIDGFGDWLILISSRADSDLREWRRRDKTTFKMILKKIRDLSNGEFSANNQHRVNRGDVVPIFEAKATFDSRLVYQVDCIRETSAKEKQVIRMFGIYSSTELKSQLWDAIGRQLNTKGKEYKDRCIFRSPLSSDKRHFLPAIFPAMQEKLVEESSLITDLLKDVSDHELQTILILQKFIPFSRALLNSIFANLDAVFPFEVSPEEKSIIDHPFSCYVLGRSGTGKTTAMLHKMLWIERSFEINTNGTTKARQMFVTKSSVLAEKVKEYFNKMLESLGMSDKSPEELKAMAQAQKCNELDDLVDKDEDFDLNSSLPTKFSDLRDEHFPLFLTFDHLCALLEADMARFGSIKASGNNVDHNDANQSGWNTSRCRGENFVSYNNFLGSYWHHFNQAFTKGLDSYSVFNELLGVIQGSEIAALSTQKCIDADTYKTLSERSNPTFPTKRSIVYEIFQSYRKMKRQTSSYDAADRTHALLRSIQVHDMPGRKLDCIYIDEAQDNLMIDALLLRILCRNPDGLFWAGDTAQTISSGCCFRFQDLKSMLYRIEKQAEKVISGSKSELPKTFYLTVNYRSHTGIVDCAHSVIELIQEHWPYSIDALAPEKGLIIGAPPVFLAERNSDDIQFVITFHLV